MSFYIGNQAIPFDNTKLIILELDPTDFGRCQRLSKNWYKLGQKDELWKLIWQRFCPTDPLACQNTKARIIHYYKHSVKSIQELALRTSKFILERPKNKKIIFICDFLRMPESQIRIEVSKGKAKSNDNEPLLFNFYFIEKRFPTNLMQGENALSYHLVKSLNHKHDYEIDLKIRCRDEISIMSIFRKRGNSEIKRTCSIC